MFVVAANRPPGFSRTWTKQNHIASLGTTEWRYVLPHAIHVPLEADRALSESHSV